jgi:hypothetical protein
MSVSSNPRCTSSAKTEEIAMIRANRVVNILEADSQIQISSDSPSE